MDAFVAGSLLTCLNPITDTVDRILVIGQRTFLDFGWLSYIALGRGSHSARSFLGTMRKLTGIYTELVTPAYLIAIYSITSLPICAAS